MDSISSRNTAARAAGCFLATAKTAPNNSTSEATTTTMVVDVILPNTCTKKTTRGRWEWFGGVRWTKNREIHLVLLQVASWVLRVCFHYNQYHRKMSRLENPCDGERCTDRNLKSSPQITVVCSSIGMVRHHWVRCTLRDHFFLMDCALVLHYWPSHA